jgi:tRNA(fMet)-specific endonuclease VapC
MIIADTDVLIDFLRGHEPVSETIALELRRGLSTTVISAFELWSGSVGSSKRESAVSTLLDALSLVPLSARAARQAADIRHSLQIQGRSMGMADALIAGICLEQRAALLTRNHKHFENIPGLTLGDFDTNQG